MGASSSTDQISSERHEIESLAASTGALPMLQKAFSVLADPQSNLIPPDSLKKCFCLNSINLISEAHPVLECFPVLLSMLGSSIVDQYFLVEKEGISWIEFVRGYLKSCGRMSVSFSLNALFKIFSLTFNKAGLPLQMQVESDDDDNVSKVTGSFVANDVLMFLSMCWVMSWKSKTSKSLNGKVDVYLPDMSPLVLSAITSDAEGGNDIDVWDYDISKLEVQLPAGKFHVWVLTTVPSLVDSFHQFVNTSLRYCTTLEQQGSPDSSSSSTVGVFSGERSNSHLLTHGRTWAISLTIPTRSTISEEILRTCFHNNADASEAEEILIYRSSIHGKGLNRFWANVEGYHGALLILISGSSGGDDNRWIIGVLTQQGFESRDVYYGTSGNLYAIHPVFNVYLSSGKEKNFVYSHLHPTRRVYEAHPKPVQIAFGGSLGNERISLDEDFAKVTIRHHAVDKTYQHGPLIPNQGFLPVEASVFEVEVWGLGGIAAKQTQNSYQQREQLFTEQRRKIDLNTFTNWEDSPEKIMMDMVTNPNKVQREDR